MTATQTAPAPTPLRGGGTPMTETEAAWVRANVWTQPMRKSYAETPGYWTACACTWSPTQWCTNGQHERCHRATPQPVPYGFIGRPDGVHGCFFPTPYAHPMATATGADRDADARLWLAGHVCAWRCGCSCHAAPAPPAQLDLFALEPA